MKIKENIKSNSEMKDKYKMVNKLIKDDKIKFEFYNDNLDNLELLQICYNNINDTIELKFKNLAKEYLEEMKKITKENTKG